MRARGANRTGARPLAFTGRRHHAHSALLAIGFLLLAACLLLGRLFSAKYPSAMHTATIAFISLWLLISAFNLWVGVTKAGYTAADELQFFF